jgi:hypothetical protein
MQPSVKIALSDDFLRCFAGIPRDRQHAVLKFLAQFRENPTSRGINYEKINDAADANMRSVRIDQNYRGIILKPESGNVYCLLWVAKHDDAYEWARRHKAAIHPEAGNIQVFEASHVQPVMPPVDAVPQRTGLFAELRDRELIRLGVPEEALAKVRTVDSEDSLDALQRQIPDDAYEALFMFAAGDTYETLIRERELPEKVDTADFSKALELDATKRHFVVITEDSDLDALLSAPLAMWRVFLHPSQRKLVERDWNGPVRVLGGAGTGKTVVAMHRAVWLARNRYVDAQGKPVLFTTFTRTLADDIRSNIEMIASPAERDRIEVINNDQWAIGILRRFGYRPQLLFEERQRRELWDRALTRKSEDADYPNSFYRAEFERVVLPHGCESADDYMLASRVGRGLQLSRPQRKMIWPVFAEYRAQLRSANLREPEEAYRDALALLKKNGANLGIRSIVIDETQDLSASALALLRAAVPEGQNDMFLVGDAHQRIYRHRATLSKVGIDIRGRGRRLRINYRTTDEIRRWAAARLANCSVDDLDGQADTLVGYKSLTHGPAPDDMVIDSRDAERKAIAETLSRLEGEGIPEKSICIVVRTNEESVEYTEWLDEIGRKVLRLDRDSHDDQNTPGVRVATMHRVKGLEFDAVIIAGYKGPEHLAKTFAEDADSGVYVDVLTNERCLLHVAATRAKRYLMVRGLRAD